MIRILPLQLDWGRSGESRRFAGARTEHSCIADEQVRRRLAALPGRRRCIDVHEVRFGPGQRHVVRRDDLWRGR